MSRIPRGLIPLAFLMGFVLPARAQVPVSQHRMAPYVTAFGGAGYFGRFIEQDFDDGQRELKGKKISSVGGGVAIGTIAGRNGGQVGMFFLPTSLRWSDDSGRNSDALDQDKIVDLDAYVFSAEFIRYLAEPGTHMIAPYTMTGVTATYWKLGDTGGQISGAGADGTDDALFKFGVTAGFGAQIETGRSMTIRFGLDTAKLGNPFSGKDSFTPVDGQTFDEPGTVTSIAGFLGLTYTFGG